MKMLNISYSEFVAALTKPGQAVLSGLTPQTAHLMHMAIGISGEAGELLDAVKKAAIYCKSLDLTNIVEELGDLEFYMEGLRASLNISRGEVIEANKSKLMKRYTSLHYSNEAAQARADKS
jgi:NTP pyrophosphatase (non-canonical NTP hydrolase)